MVHCNKENKRKKPSEKSSTKTESNEELQRRLNYGSMSKKQLQDLVEQKTGKKPKNYVEKEDLIKILL